MTKKSCYGNKKADCFSAIGIVKIQLSEHLALQIRAAQIIRVGIIDIGIEVRNFIGDERGENIDNRLCGIIVLHGGQHQSLIQHSDGSCRRNFVAALGYGIKITVRNVEPINQFFRDTCSKDKQWFTSAA